LEQEIANVLQNSSQMLEREDKELSLEEEEALKNMSLEEVCVLASFVGIEKLSVKPRIK
jgi:hypothetical protein